MLSAVVPTLNAQGDLLACLQRLSGADEQIIVDGGSADATCAIAREAGATLLATRAGRGHQLREGIAIAGGDWILVVHADTLLEPGWQVAAARHMRDCPDAAAYFRFRLRASGLRPRLLERLVALRCRLFALPYGDQGLLIPRALYDRVGGFADLPLMEDVDLARRIGRSRLKQIDADALTCARRWQSDGWLARSARNLACLLLYRLGMPPERIKRFYG